MKTALEKVIEIIGSQTSLGEKIGLGQATVSAWINRYQHKVGSDYVIAVAEAVEWKITPHELRPDIYPHPDDGLPDAMRGDGLPAVFSNNRKVEQSAARLAHNQEVAGSNPALATNNERAQ